MSSESDGRETPPQRPAKDPSRGWEGAAQAFLECRSPSIGVDVVAAWISGLPAGAKVLDLGCGHGIPHGQQLEAAGLEVFAIDAAPTLAAAYARHCPRAVVACEDVETSRFFDQQFSAVLSTGLIFLLPASVQRSVLVRVASTLLPAGPAGPAGSGGSLLFSAPAQVCQWDDLLTGQTSQSLGKEAYVALLATQQLRLIDEPRDEGENHYFHFVRTA